MGKLEGKVAVITAATSGMALATAKLFVEEGAYRAVAVSLVPFAACSNVRMGRPSRTKRNQN